MIVFFVLVPPCLVLAGAVVWANFIKPPPGRHAFADPADRTDPDGEAFIASLRDPDGDWRERHAPPPRVEVLARGTGQFPMLPPDPDPDVTGVQPADVRYLGKPSGDYVEELFAKHAPPPEVIP